MKRQARNRNRVRWASLRMPTSQDAVEAFWDELVLRADPRAEDVAAKAVRAAQRAAWTALASARREDGQGAIEYVLIVLLVLAMIIVFASLLVPEVGDLWSKVGVLIEAMK